MILTSSVLSQYTRVTDRRQTTSNDTSELAMQRSAKKSI